MFLDRFNKIIKRNKKVKYKRDGFKKYLSKNKFDIKNINFKKFNIKNINIDKIIKVQSEKSLIVRVFNYIFFCWLLFFFCSLLLGACSKKVAFGIWKHLIIPCYNIIYCLSQHLTFKMGRFVFSPIILFLIIIIINLILLIVVGCINSNKEKKDGFIKKIKVVSNVCCFIVFFEIGLLIMTLNNPKIDEIYYKKQIKNKYKVSDIVKLEENMKNKIIEYSHMMSRNKNGEIIYNGDIVGTASADLENISSKFDIFKGPYIKKIYHFDNYDFSYDPSTVGYTFLDNVGMSYEQELPQVISTATHELCHTKGIARENEAVLCSIIAGVESDNSISNYGAYIESYYRISDALKLIDLDAARSFENEIDDLCINNNYKEICNFHAKDLEVYVQDSSIMEIGTYRLKSYNKDTFYELINNLKEFKPKFYINGDKKIKKSELDGYFDDEKAFLTIEINNSDENFIKIKKIIDNSPIRLKSVIQEYDDMYTGIEMGKKEAIKYYTSSVPSSNVFSLNRDKTFDYSRVVRLLLEYFDSKNV